MLSAMRPRDARYAAIPLPAGSPAVDASVRAVVLCCPSSIRSGATATRRS